MKKDWLMLFLAVMFSSVCWPMAVWFGYGWVKQAQTSGWPAAAEAEVLESRVVTRSGRKGGTTYKPSVKYRYRVGEQWHIDERITFTTGFGDSGGGYAQTVVSAYPVGAKVTVYADPDDWTRSVLFKGLHDRDWQTLAFIAPFAVVPLVVWGVFIGSVMRGGRGHVGTVRVFEPGPGVSVFRDVAFGPWAMGMGTLLGCSIVTVILIVGFVDTHTRDTLFVCWGATLVLSVAAWFGRRHWINAGRLDGVIDLNEGTFSFARGFKREPEVVELARIVDTTLMQDSRRSTNKRRHWRVHLLVEGMAKTRPVADICHKADAQAFDDWLRKRVALTGADAL